MIPDRYYANALASHLDGINIRVQLTKNLILAEETWGPHFVACIGKKNLQDVHRSASPESSAKR